MLSRNSLNMTPNDSAVAWMLHDPVVVHLWMYSGPAFLVIGTIANLFSVFILTRKRVWKRRISPFLVGLELADSSVIWVLAGTNLYTVMKGVNPYELSDLYCKLYWFLLFVTSKCSAWYILAITVDRAIAVRSIKIERVLANGRIVTRLAWAIPCIAILFDLHVFICHTRSSAYFSIANSRCGFVSRAYMHFYMDVYFWLNLLVTLGIPCVTVVIGNIYIQWKLAQFRRKIRRVTAHDSQPDYLERSNRNPASLHQLSPNEVRLNTLDFAQTCPSQKDIHLTMLCSVLSIAFAIGVLPMFICVGKAINLLESVDTSDGAARLIVIGQQFYYLNCSVNFILYCWTSRDFRLQVQRMFGKGHGINPIQPSAHPRDRNDQPIAQVNIRLNDFRGAH